MAFTDAQIRMLSGKLNEKFVKTRAERGLTLSYIEAWHVIDEANRVFGFEGWDRETVWAECVWADGRREPKACSYAVRVRIRVRAGEGVVFRDGSGVGHGTGATLGEAHESALKEAETDATKRALTTFGNLFGLALYDKAQNGVRRSPKPNGTRLAWVLVSAAGNLLGKYDTPQRFCAALREAIEGADAGGARHPLDAQYRGHRAAAHRLPRPQDGPGQPLRRHPGAPLPATPAPGIPRRGGARAPARPSTSPSWPSPRPSACATRRIASSWPPSPASSAGGPPARRTISASPSPARWAARSATNSRCRSAPSIIARCTTSATRSNGGRSTASMPRPRPSGCGARATARAPRCPPSPCPAPAATVRAQSLPSHAWSGRGIGDGNP